MTPTHLPSLDRLFNKERILRVSPWLSSCKCVSEKSSYCLGLFCASVTWLCGIFVGCVCAIVEVCEAAEGMRDPLFWFWCALSENSRRWALRNPNQLVHDTHKITALHNLKHLTLMYILSYMGMLIILHLISACSPSLSKVAAIEGNLLKKMVKSIKS